MKQEIETANFSDDGKPYGGYVRGVGLSINWQRGPLVENAMRQEPNGCFVETVIEAAKQRLEFYQDSPFKCRENELAITHLSEALVQLNKRTMRREQEGKEGTWLV